MPLPQIGHQKAARPFSDGRFGIKKEDVPVLTRPQVKSQRRPPLYEALWLSGKSGGRLSAKKVRAERKKLEMAEFLFDLTDTFRPKRMSAPGGTVIRFHRNATEFRAECVREIKRKFCRVNIFQRPEGFAVLTCAATVPQHKKHFCAEQAFRVGYKLVSLQTEILRSSRYDHRFQQNKERDAAPFQGGRKGVCHPKAH